MFNYYSHVHQLYFKKHIKYELKDKDNKAMEDDKKNN